MFSCCLLCLHVYMFAWLYVQFFNVAYLHVTCLRICMFACCMFTYLHVACLYVYMFACCMLASYIFACCMLHVCIMHICMLNAWMLACCIFSCCMFACVSVVYCKPFHVSSSIRVKLLKKCKQISDWLI